MFYYKKPDYSFMNCLTSELPYVAFFLVSTQMESTSNKEFKINSHKERIRAIVGGSLGNLVEWYDWYVYSAFAIYFSPYFFPKSNQTAQLLNSAGIFAVGFLMRPV